jgi:transcriptional regulator with PAS, ATPase and Fis domain
MKPSQIRQAVIDFISQKGDDGVLASEIGRDLNLNRHTLAKHLEVLNGQDILIFRRVGMAKLWFLNRRPFSAILETDQTDSVLSGIFQEVINKTSNLVFVVDNEYNLIYMNKAAKDAFGNCTGQKCYDIFETGMPCKKFCVVKEFLKKNIEGKQEHITGVNGKSYRVTGFTIRNPDGSHCAIEIANDITHEVELERELAEIKKILNKK